MDGRRAIPWIAAVVLTGSWAEPAAEAQRRRRPAHGEEAAPVDEDTQRAREAYERGRTAFQAGSFREALSAFQEAYDTKPHPTVLVSIAECQERLGQLPQAVTTLEQYLRESPQARDRAQVEEKIAAIRARPATLVISSEPPGAAIVVDGEGTGKVTPADVEVAPGDHTVKLTLSGYRDAEEQVTVTFAERREMPVGLEEANARDTGMEEEGEPEPEPEQPREGGTPAAVFIGVGLAGVGLVAGGVFGFLALGEKSDFDDNPTDDTADSGERFALLADVSFGVAAAAGIATICYFITRGSAADDAEEVPDEEVRLRLSPMIGRRTGGLAAQLEF